MLQISPYCRKYPAFIAGLIIIAYVGTAFGNWFSLQQIHAVYAQASPAIFPFFARIITILQCTLAIAAAWALTHLVITSVCTRRISPVVTALTFAPLYAVYFSQKPLHILLATLLIQIAVSVFSLRISGCLGALKFYAVDIMALGILLCMYLCLTTAFSPLTDTMPLLNVRGPGVEEIPIVASLFRQYAFAGQYSFSSVDYSEWAALMHPPVTLNSTLLQLATFIFALPPIDVESFHKAMHLIQFLLMVGGSFGCYLFLKYAANVRSIIALIGGALFFFSGAPLFGNMFTYDGGVLITPFALFPYALLFIALAFKKEEYRYGVLAGIALAAQFFFYTPHPEGTIYSAGFFTVFGMGLYFFTPGLHWGKKEKLCALAVALLTFLLASSYVILPIIWDSAAGYMYTFAHIGDITASPLEAYKPYPMLLFCILPLYWWINGRTRKIEPVHAALIIFSVFLFFTLYLTSSLRFNKALISVFHLGLHLGDRPWRIGLYLFFGVLCLSMITLEAIARLIKHDSVWCRIVVNGIFAALSFAIFPIELLTNYSRVGNPDNCRYYITLQSLLANAHGMEKNAANALLIKDRLQDFQNALAHAPQTIRNEYETAYAASIRGAVDDNAIKLAGMAYPIIDRFYLDTRLFCRNPLYDFAPPQDPHRERRVLRHNLAGLYVELPPYKTILFGVHDWAPGAAPGLWVNNESMTFDPKFMTAMPLFTALYILPKYDFTSVGTYSAPMPVLYYTPSTLSDKVTRKVLDIAGIDIFTVYKHEIKAPIPDTEPLTGKVNPNFDAGMASFINLDSYGLAYLANHISYADENAISADEASLRKYFSTIKKNPQEFRGMTERLYDRLLQLKDKHDIVLETEGEEMLGEGQATPAGTLQINGIVGEKALFTADCKRSECEMVFNVSWVPGWRAYVNNVPQDIARANFAFLAVKVPHGLSHIWLVYDSWIQIISSIISLLTLTMVAVVCSNCKQNKK